MPWNSAITFTTATVTGNDLDMLSAMEAYLKGTGESVTARDKIVLAPWFDLETPAFLGTYSSSGYTFAVEGENRDGTPAISEDDEVGLVGIASETAGHTEERLGLVLVRRGAGSGDGILRIQPYESSEEGQTLPFLAPIYIDTSNNVWIFRDPSGTPRAMNVGGSVRAAQYRQGGVTFGNWTRGSDGVMRFTGNAEVSGSTAQLQVSSQGAAPFETVSRTKVTGLSAASVGGYSWPSQLLEAAGTNVSVPPDGSEVTIASLPALQREGFYLILAEMSVPFTTEVRYAGPVYMKVPGEPVYTRWTGTPEEEEYTGWKVYVEQRNELAPARIVTRYRASAGQVLSLKAVNYTSRGMRISGSIAARWLSAGMSFDVPSLKFTAVFGGMTEGVT